MPSNAPRVDAHVRGIHGACVAGRTKWFMTDNNALTQGVLGRGERRLHIGALTHDNTLIGGIRINRCMANEHTTLLRIGEYNVSSVSW